MDHSPEQPRRFPAVVRGVGQVVWALVWLLLAFFMFVWGLCGLNFVVVGILSFFIDLGSFGPRLGGELVQSTAGAIAFTIAGAGMAATSVVFFRLASGQRYLAAVIVFAVSWALFLAVGLLTGIHGISGGIGSAGYGW
jgi:hypothetical protein